MSKGNQNVFGNNTTHYPGVNADRRGAKLAAQQIVGLWTERRTGPGITCRNHPVADGQIVIGCTELTRT